MTSIGLAIAIAAARAVAQPAEPVPATPDAGVGSGSAPGSAATGSAPAGPGSGSAAGSGSGSDSENLLAHINDEPDADAKKGHNETFGKQLQLFGMETNWSGYGDLLFETVPNQNTATFDATHFNPVFSVRMSDVLSGEMELEFEHGGLGINAEYAMIDLAPFGTRELVIRAGKFLVPFGRFNEQLHPSFRWSQIDRPLMMTEIVPVEWSDVGVQVRGQIKSGDLAFDYAAFVANGLNEHPGATGAEADEGELGFIAGLRSNLLDSNRDKGLGARAAITSSSGDKSTVSLGVSGYTGRTSPAGDPDGPERLTMVDVDAYARQGALFIIAEFAQAFFGSQTLGYYQTFERGAYLQLGYTIERSTLVGRYDYASLGSQDGGMVGPLTGYHALALTYKFAPSPTWSIRLEVTQPLKPSDTSSNTKLATGLAFVF
jgi:hypothetical protein